MGGGDESNKASFYLPPLTVQLEGICWSKCQRFLITGFERGTEPDSGPEKGNRWCELTEIPSKGRGSSRHRSGLPGRRDASKISTAFCCAKVGFYHSGCCQVPSSHVPERQREGWKVFQESESNEGAQKEMQESRPGNNEDICGEVQGREKQGRVDRPFLPLTAQLMWWFALSLKLMKMTSTFLCGIWW